MAKQLQQSCLENLINCMKRQKDMTVEGELPRSVGAQYSTGVEPRAERMKQQSQSGNSARLWTCLVMEARANAVKRNVA